MTAKQLLLGDTLCLGVESPKLLKALAVMERFLHTSFEDRPGLRQDWTKDSCVMLSLAAREFLSRIGFTDTHVMTVCAVMYARENGQDLHSVGIGHPDNMSVETGRWNGHLVVVIPSARILFDPTLYQAKRPQWSDLPGMVAVPLATDNSPQYMGMPIVASFSMTDDERPGYLFTCSYFDNNSNTGWRNGPDAKRRHWRTPVADKLVAEFGEWKE